MTRFFSRSLFGQTALILLAGLIVSHAVGSWIYTADREQAVRTVGAFATAQRMANLTRLVQDTPREARHRIVKYWKGGNAEIRMRPRAVEIDIDDEGPRSFRHKRQRNTPGADLSHSQSRCLIATERHGTVGDRRGSAGQSLPDCPAKSNIKGHTRSERAGSIRLTKPLLYR